MSNPKLPSLIDKVYELAGLLEVTQRRDDTPDSFRDAIRTKAIEIQAEIAEIFAPSPAPSPAPAPADDDYFEEECESTSEDPSFFYVCSEPEPAPAPAPEPTPALEPAHVPAPEPAPAPAPAPEFRPLPKVRFSVNDRFFFARELFGNDRAAFDAFVARASDAVSIPELESLFFSRGWDLDATAPRHFFDLFAQRL